ncbi:cbb3-type cytochrome c oxidase subunit I [Eoetvoesiella caeni]|uniref:Cytochrome c oxidase cbb3-type subunit 1 n=1 Tax=Eoetvoesiella caeni TaxID=645616 RepID=A0A366H1Q0_9BURK|nr:cbb3-type cytochrome c oxidase subunit I [Eoetvoesiella caeni]MCI2811084.1 cbb3-type cytochrome c oxidase subunit I [Eoetvoesiella caeni]NYT57004.1 cbb3-type cytochrome c oxidase subunit I [Eoetvoesiella caeni]RBP35166.1 cytochrome c oxidase cbb3-type subunit 1 [Eoetvoesiella caeni]
MNPTALLLATFILSIVGLFTFIWSLRKGLFDAESSGARTIFSQGEIGRPEDPAADQAERHALSQIAIGNVAANHGVQTSAIEMAAREEADRSSAFPAFVLIGCAVVWLIVASFAGLLASLKLHWPDLLTDSAWLSFGRLRTMHLNGVAYGWAPLGLLGISIWLLPRLLQTKLLGGRLVVFGALLWNAALIAGMGGLAIGINAGLEWLEIPWQIGAMFAVGGMLVGLPMALMLTRRKAKHLYVSVWYMGAALFWFPTLYIVAKIPGVHFGVEQATMNWWYGHNVLGLFYTPLSIAAIYYFLPKVIGRPVRSYNLSLVGFWTLAFFYGQVGAHHLIGGPIPEWLITLSIVQSVMMIIPVVAFSMNQHLTLKGHFNALRHSMVLRFIVFGAIMYTLASVQGSFEALRSLNAITHFTHFTVAHAHLGMYGFVSMVIFGGVYFVMPRILNTAWPKPQLISYHFWLVVGGYAVYLVTLSIGGVLQGLALLDPARGFMESVAVTMPWLQGRSVGGALMTLGHLVFALHVALIVLRSGVLSFVEPKAAINTPPIEPTVA